MHKFLPNRVHVDSDGEIHVDTLDTRDFELIGLFLACHLMVEHHMDELLRVSFPQLAWKDARLNFSQKLELISKRFDAPPFGFISALRKFNSLRNQMAHRLDHAITLETLKPMSDYLTNAQVRVGGAAKGEPAKPMIEANTPREILHWFSTTICTALTGAIVATVAVEHGPKALDALKKLQAAVVSRVVG